MYTSAEIIAASWETTFLRCYIPLAAASIGAMVIMFVKNEASRKHADQAKPHDTDKNKIEEIID